MLYDLFIMVLDILHAGSGTDFKFLNNKTGISQREI